MVRIAIVDDDDFYVKQLVEYLDRYQQENDIEITVDIFTDGAMLVERYNKDYSIILLDIEMPLLDGMAAAEEIRKVDEAVVIIFITNMAQFAIKGYSVGALDYVVKPIAYFAFSQCLQKAIARARKPPVQYLTISSRNGIQKLNIADIYYIESQGNSLLYHTSSGEHKVTGTLKSVEASLKDKAFERGNSGYLINLRHVDAITDSFAIVHGSKLPLSRSRKGSFIKAFSSFIER